MNEQMKTTLLVVFCVATLFGAGSAIYYKMDAISLQQQLDERESELAEAKESAKKMEHERRNMMAFMQRAPRPEDGKENGALAEENERLKSDLAAFRDNANRERGNNNQNRGGNMQERMERLKEENPERYEEMMAMRQKMEERQAKRNDYFAKIDTSRMNDEQRSAVERYQQLMQQQQSGERVDFREMMTLNNQVREALLSQYTGSTADAIKEVYEMTGNGGGMMPMGGGPRGGNRGGFGGGNRGGNRGGDRGGF